MRFFPLFLLLIFSGLDADAALCPPKLPVAIAYINGVDNTALQAKDNLQILLQLTNSLPGGQARYSPFLAYNPTKGAFSDLGDVLQQKLNEYPGIGIELLVRGITGGGLSAFLPNTLADWIKNYLVSKIQTKGYVSYNDADLKVVESWIRVNTVKGQKILLVPHSQGNLYANAVYNKLTTGTNPVALDHLKIAGVASPAAYVAGNGKYGTGDTDLVIGGLRLVFPNTLPANLSAEFSTDDVLGHSFSDVYLAQSASRAYIANAINQAFPDSNSTAKALAANACAQDKIGILVVGEQIGMSVLEPSYGFADLLGSAGASGTVFSGPGYVYYGLPDGNSLSTGIFIASVYLLPGTSLFNQSLYAEVIMDGERSEYSFVFSPFFSGYGGGRQFLDINTAASPTAEVNWH